MTLKMRLEVLDAHIENYINEVTALKACKQTAVTQIITHGDFDGAASAVLLAERLGLTLADLNVIFTQPFLVDQVKIPDEIERIYVCDIAINNRNLQMTEDFINKIQDRLYEWYEHHIGWSTSRQHPRQPKEQNLNAWNDYKFTIDETAPACAEIIGTKNEKMKWIIADAIVADTREGTMSPTGQMIEDGIKADPNNDDVKLAAVKLMLGDESQRAMLEEAARKYAAVLDETNRLARTYEADGKPMTFFSSGDAGNSPVPGQDYHANVSVVDARESNHKYDLTQLLLAGQDLAAFAVAKTISPHTGEENLTIATKSGVNLVELFDLGSGAPFRVSLPIERFDEAIEKLGGVTI